MFLSPNLVLHEFAEFSRSVMHERVAWCYLIPVKKKLCFVSWVTICVSVFLVFVYVEYRVFILMWCFMCPSVLFFCLMKTRVFYNEISQFMWRFILVYVKLYKLIIHLIHHSFTLILVCFTKYVIKWQVRRRKLKYSPNIQKVKEKLFQTIIPLVFFYLLLYFTLT